MPRPASRLGGGFSSLSVPCSTMCLMTDLSADDAAVLAFERRWWKHAGAKEQAIRDQFGTSATAYYARVNRLLDDPTALAADPVLINRLRRLRESRRRARATPAR